MIFKELIVRLIWNCLKNIFFNVVLLFIDMLFFPGGSSAPISNEIADQINDPKYLLIKPSEGASQKGPLPFPIQNALG